MTDRLNIGVVGVGHLGMYHARVLSESQVWNLAGVYDIDPAKNRDIAAQCQLSVCDSVSDLVSRCDALVVCTPTQSHCQIATMAIQAGKHVLVEKPLAGSSREVDELVRLADAQEVVGAVGHIERFNPAVLAVRDQIEHPRFIEAHRLNLFSPRGLATDIVLEVMIHDIDLARWLTGEEPSEIRAAGVHVLSETDDIANCRLAFPSGCVANLTASRISTAPMRKLRVFSVNRYTSIDLQTKSAETYRLFEAGSSDAQPTFAPVASWQGRVIGRRSADIADSNALEDELADFHAAITGDGRPRVGFRDGAQSVRIALAVAEACRNSAQVARTSVTV